MKRIMILAAMAVMAMQSVFAEDREAVLSANVQCDNCVRNINDKIRFEKGVKKIKTNLDDKTVVIVYNGDKNNAEALAAAVTKIGYEAKVVSDKPVKKKKK